MDNTYKNECIDKAKLERAIDGAMKYYEDRLKWYINRANTVTDWTLRGINYEEASNICERIAELENVKNRIMKIATLD